MEKVTSFQITSLTMSGFKCYDEPTRFDFGNPTTITGGNGRGKSSIADAIAFTITGLPFFAERKLDPLHCDDNGDLHITMEYMDQAGIAHCIHRSRKAGRMTIALDDLEIRQMDLNQMFGEKDVFLSIFNPLYFIEELGDDGKNLLARHLPPVTHETILEGLNPSTRQVVESMEFTSAEGCIRDLRAEMLETKEHLVYLAGQRDLTREQSKQVTQSKQALVEQLAILTATQKHLEDARFANVSVPHMEAQLVEMSQKYDDLAHDTTAKEVATLVAQREARMTETYQSKLLDALAEQSAKVNQLMTQYKQEIATAKALQAGGQCPTCHRPITAENLPQVQDGFQQILRAIQVEGQSQRENLIELQTMDSQCHAKFLEFQQEDVAKLEAQILEIQAQSEDTTLTQLRSQIQELTTMLDYGNLTHEEYEQLSQCHQQILQCQSELEALEAVTLHDSTYFDEKIKKSEQDLKKSKLDLTEMVAYLSKKTELTFACLQMNRVAISLYDVVKSTGEVKDVFRFTYNGRRYDRLSLSEKVRAGMEVSQLIGRLTGRNYPVFVDNMESVDDLANVRPKGQIILAKCVANTDLMVKGKPFAKPLADAA